MPDSVAVTCRHGTYPGIRSGRVGAYEFRVPDEYAVRGVGRLQRVFLLLDDHIQVHQPLTFPEQYRDWWYVDLVRITETKTSIAVVDHWLDVAVPPDGMPYRVMDGDELGEALREGKVTAEEVAVGLVRFQAFLDRYLHGPLAQRGYDGMNSSWHDFPPAALREVDTAAIPPL